MPGREWGMGNGKWGRGNKNREARGRFPVFVLIHVFELFIVEFAGDHFIGGKLTLQ